MPSSIPTRPDAIALLSKKDTELADILEDLPPFSYDTSDPQGTINFLRKVLSHPRKPDPRVCEHEVVGYRKARNGQSMKLFVFEPATVSTKPLPLVVLFHGGGYTVGSPRNVAEPAKTLVLSETNPCIVVAPQYLLAPENPFPGSVIDAYDAVHQLTHDFADNPSFSQDVLKLLPGAQAELRHEKAGGFVVGGVSAGATMSCVLGHLARDVVEKKLAVPITGLYLGCPAPLPTEDLVPEAYKHRWLARSDPECLKEDPVLPEAVAQIFTDSLKPDVKSPLYVPFAWPASRESVNISGNPFGVVSSASESKGGHGGLPPTYIQACGRDRARDDALIFASQLRKEDVKTRIDVYPGLPHMFWALFNMLGAFGKWQQDTAAGVAWLLSEDHDSGCSGEDE